jgi:hypothetical protein
VPPAPRREFYHAVRIGRFVWRKYGKHERCLACVQNKPGRGKPGSSERKGGGCGEEANSNFCCRCRLYLKDDCPAPYLQGADASVLRIVEAGARVRACIPPVPGGVKRWSAIGIQAPGLRAVARDDGGGLSM